MKQNVKPLLFFWQTSNNQSKQNYKHIQNNKKLNLKQQLIHKKTPEKTRTASPFENWEWVS